MFQLNLVTPERSLAKKVEVEELIVPGSVGELHIKPGHAPLITTLSEGVLRFKAVGESDFVEAAISWGYCEVGPIGVQILADTAELPEDIDKQRAEATLVKAEKELSDFTKLNPEQIEKYQRKLKRARIRVNLAK